jgi:nucleotide-binding universal stress UspA family protein
MTGRIRINHILCPIDFSPFSTRALRHAAALARRFDARITGLHVVPQWQPYSHMPAYLPAPLLADAATRERVTREVLAFISEGIGAPLALDVVVREAEPWREILSVAAEKAADLIVMGTHGRGGFEHLLMGSVAEKVLQRAGCPVVTVCHEEGRTWEAPGLVRNILCATDLSPASGPTIGYALSLAAEFQCTLVLLHVLDTTATSATAVQPRLPTVAVFSQHEAIVRQQMREAISDDRRQWCSVQERIVSGRPYEEILRAAVQVEADLIVVGGRTHGLLAGAVLGSTSHHVIRAASCPVLTVRVPVQPAAVRPTEAAAAAEPS